VKSAGRKKLKTDATKKSRQTKTRRLGSKEASLRVADSRRLSKAKPNLITLLTDFGSADYFVAAIKGVILSAQPSARIVDITHDIPPQDIEAAAFTILAAHSAFPKDTIHVAVVDPGVGSNRRAILVEVSGQFFVGPDNGIFSYVYDLAKPRVFQLNNPRYFRQPVSDTFNGRDIFAPVAAALARGVASRKLGVEVDDYVRLPTLKAGVAESGVITARIIHIDHFGNCVTNITRNELTEAIINDGFRLEVKGQRIEELRRFFAEETRANELFCVWGSAGFLEIVAKNQSAAKLLQAKRGDSVVLTRT
jgi:S-adenosylmethionine hydrolase